MPIPRYDEAMAPIMRGLASGMEQPIAEIRDGVAEEFKVTPRERELRLPSAPRIRLLDDRVHWAVYYLMIAGLVERHSRGVYKLSPLGRTAVTKLPQRIDKNYLVANFEAARSYFAQPKGARRGLNGSSSDRTPSSDETTQGPLGGASHTPEDRDTPLDRLDEAYTEIRADVVSELTSRLVDCDPTVFESIATRLIAKMGYANDEDDIVQLHGKSGDGGIDGRVKKDPLGLEQVWIQAKRWRNPARLADVEEFYDLVKRTGARMGIFVARSGFSADAWRWIEHKAHPDRLATVAWLDGDRLVELMIRYKVGVKEIRAYSIDGIDEGTFTRETE